MEHHEDDIYYCNDCESKVKGFHRFCHNCGAYLGSDAEQVDVFSNRNLRAAFIFYTIYLFVCSLITDDHSSQLISLSRLKTLQ